MAKRKHNAAAEVPIPLVNGSNKKLKATAPSKTLKTLTKPLTIQIIAGSYDRVLHGITASISSTSTSFSDTFLFDAHTSALRCLALSPPSAPVPNQLQKIILATGSTDERINLYHLSAHPPSKTQIPPLPTLSSKAVKEDPSNRELGSLMHHSASTTKLQFATRGKLLSSAEDSTIAVTRTRDWSLLSTIKAPVPKSVGRPSGDTAPAGGQPSGINDFAVHPSLKLMVSVSKGEKCMRLWNLVTGKKAGVLNFGRELLGEVGEGRWASGEGRKVDWGGGGEGNEFVVGFERGCVVFGMDSRPKCKVGLGARGKVHQVRYVEVREERSVLAISTEDGKILFYSTTDEDLTGSSNDQENGTGLPSAKLLGWIGGKDAGVSARMKDFVCLKAEETDKLFFVGASSDGALRLWKVSITDLEGAGEGKQVGDLLGTYETGNRITCLAAFVMISRPEGLLDNEEEDEDFEEFEGAEEEEDDESQGESSDESD